MKIAILSFQSKVFQNFSAVDELADRAVRLGHEVEVVVMDDLTFCFDAKKSVLRNGKPLKKYDIMIARPRIIADPSIPATLLHEIEKSGQIFVNGPAALVAAKNKIKSLQILSEKKVAIAKSTIVNGRDQLEHAARTHKFPIVIKTAYGTYGTGVFLAESMSSLRSIVDFIFSRGFDDPVVLQTYYKEVKGKDIRAFVVGNKVIAAMQRSAKRDEFRANFHQGGDVAEIKLTPAQNKLAIKATRALGLDYAGVDILQTKRGPLVIEVNANPGFEGITAATGVDVASEIVKYAVRMAKN